MYEGMSKRRKRSNRSRPNVLCTCNKCHGVVSKPVGKSTIYNHKRNFGLHHAHADPTYRDLLLHDFAEDEYDAKHGGMSNSEYDVDQEMQNEV